MPSAVDTSDGENYKLSRNMRGTFFQGELRETSDEQIPLYRLLASIQIEDGDSARISRKETLDSLEPFLRSRDGYREIEEGDSLVGIAVDIEHEDLYPNRAPVFKVTKPISRIYPGNPTEIIHLEI